MKRFQFLLMAGLALFAAVPSTALANGANEVHATQQSEVTVTGQVVDQDGEPMIGATVVVDGTSQGAITDLDGNFTIKVPANANLKISSIGYKSKVVKAKSGSIGVITLESDNTELDQVVVVGYGVQRKADLTGSVSIVNAEEMKKTTKAMMTVIPTTTKAFPMMTAETTAMRTITKTVTRITVRTIRTTIKKMRAEKSALFFLP